MRDDPSQSPGSHPEDSPLLGRYIYSVKDLVGEIHALLENQYREIWVEGEISNLAEPASGHRYFSLKEGNALIRCALFNSHQRGGRRPFSVPPAEGMQALVRGRIAVYTPRGDMQLIVSCLEDAGEGALRREFEQLKRELSAEGLFDDRHKQKLPAYPKVIGVLSSDSGAALHDIRVTLKARYPVARLIVYPVPVQGAAAPGAIIQMLTVANRRREADVLILARGGGSLEDLQGFNDQGVARAIFASALPVVSAVGHEIDFTIADLVADLRAPTPTAAAQAVTPELAQLQENLRQLTDHLQRSVRRSMDTLGQHLDYTSARLVHPLHRIQSAEQSRQALVSALGYLTRGCLDRQRLGLAQQTAQLRYHSPRAPLTEHQRHLTEVRKQLTEAASAALAAATQNVAHLANKLGLMNPAHILARGYAILQDENRQVVTDAAQTRPGQALSAQLTKGRLRCVVERVLDE